MKATDATLALQTGQAVKHPVVTVITLLVGSSIVDLRTRSRGFCTKVLNMTLCSLERSRKLSQVARVR